MRKRSLRGQSGAVRHGLTIVELLAVTTVLSLLASLLLPAVHHARESARRLSCCGHLQQIGIAVNVYEQAARALPPGWRLDASGESAYGWATALLPYVEQTDLHARIYFSAALNAPGHEAIRRTPLALWQCPSDPGEATFALYEEEEDHHGDGGQESERVLTELPAANYVGVFGTQDPDDVPGTSGDGAFVAGRPIRLVELKRGLSATVIVGERTARKLPSSWLGFLVEGEDAPARVVGFARRGPNQLAADECELDSRHPGVVNMLWADGHVAALDDAIAPALYQQLTRREAEPLLTNTSQPASTNEVLDGE